MKVNIGFPVVLTDGRVVGRSVYGHVITKFSGMGRFTKLWGSAEEALQPEKSIPRSLFLIIIMSTLAYVGVSTVLTSVMSYKKIRTGCFCTINRCLSRKNI